ncbi:MAG: hypothetical protein AAGB04_17220 [Pseudomonadota bacterium]
MSNNWAKNASNNILPLSTSQTSLRDALAEWFYNGNTLDLEAPVESCRLCDHPDIRYQFEIENETNGNTLLVGSECITRFSISAKADGRNLSQTDTKKLVSRDRRQLIQDARTKRVIGCLVDLAAKDDEFNDIDRSIDYYRERGAFSPNHLAFLIWRLDKNNVPYKASDMKMTIRRSREKEQLLSMPDWKLQKLLPCMSKSQRDFVER